MAEDDGDLLESIALVELGSARGGAKARQPLTIEFVRDIGVADIEVLRNPPTKGLTTSPVQRLRYHHHLLARLLAEGRGATESSLVTGLSPSRISILQNDPAFAELVTTYQAEVTAQYVDVHARLAALGMNTIEELQERLEVEPGKFSNRELIELAEMTFDRSVAPAKGGPKSGQGQGTGINISVNFTGKSAEAGPVIDLTVAKPPDDR